MNTVLITGAGGQLGLDLTAHSRRSGDRVVTATRSQLDIADEAAVAAFVADIEPDVIFNCAAWTAVDACESDPARAHLVNGEAVGYLAAASRRVGAHLVQVSTDYVFDGTKQAPYVESDRPNPQSVYGTSKLLGESRAGDDATVVRTSWVCGLGGHNMVKTVLGLVARGTPMRFVDDQRGNPSFTTDLATEIHRLGTERAAGVFHITNSTPNHAGISWFEFVQQIVIAAGGDPGIVEPIATEQLDPPRPATRPANGVLSTTRTAPLRDYREPLAELVAAIAAQN